MVSAMAISLLLAGSAAACAPEVSRTPTAGGQSADAGLRGYQGHGIQVAIADAPPYSQITADGTVTGASPEILRAVLGGLGVKIKNSVVTTYDAMIPGLAAQRWDVVAAGMVITKARCSQVAFSEPDIISTMAFGVPKGNPKNVRTISDLVSSSTLKVATMPGTHEEDVLIKAGVPAERIVKVNDPRSGLEAVKANRADAYFYTTLSLREMTKGDDKFEVTHAPKDAPITAAGVAFRQQDTELLRAYNDELAKFKKTKEYEDLMNKFGFEPRAGEGITTADVCKQAE
jgi:polar amino acid transport system substrate-binding protein